MSKGPKRNKENQKRTKKEPKKTQKEQKKNKKIPKKDQKKTGPDSGHYPVHALHDEGLHLLGPIGIFIIFSHLYF